MNSHYGRIQTENPAKRQQDMNTTIETPTSNRLKERPAKPRHVYAVIYATLPRHCIPYSPEEHKEELLEPYEELGDANNRVRREWEGYGDALGWDVEVSFDDADNMWRVEDYEGLSTGVRVYIQE
ncbi:hypothetical protein LARI1_G007032 [Lachnellula arida]|uniref:Uncharacterized protein n=1 Tax=Lachnellula arida TaxID=1316785 RepID=A0A8T9B8X0_9HELO|nr:hypothetical protein LARI1_G007032 [Lachnellula arida]